jgi:hypothetical protein
MDLLMTTNRKILADHKKRGKTLLAPFTHMIGALKEISWLKDIIPEIVWIGLIQYEHGHRRGVELITSMARLARNARSNCDAPQAFAATSSFSGLSGSEWKKLRKAMASRGELFYVQKSLAPLVALYPKCPLSPIFAKAPTAMTCDALARMKSLTSSLFQRSDRDPMMVQATATWLAFDAGKLKVQKGLALAEFPEIERYPDTELSRKVGSGVRATVNLLFDSNPGSHEASSWPAYFWNRGLEIAPCEFSDG